MKKIDLKILYFVNLINKKYVINYSLKNILLNLIDYSGNFKKLIDVHIVIIFKSVNKLSTVMHGYIMFERRIKI